MGEFWFGRVSRCPRQEEEKTAGSLGAAALSTVGAEMQHSLFTPFPPAGADHGVRVVLFVSFFSSFCRSPPVAGFVTVNRKTTEPFLRATDEDVVDGDVNQLHDVAHGAHDEEADADGLTDLDKLLLVGLGAAVHELGALLDEVPGQVQHILHLVGHCCG